LHIEGRGTKEISQLTGWSVSRVKVTAFRARLKMRKLWDALTALNGHERRGWIPQATSVSAVPKGDDKVPSPAIRVPSPI
jgi:hypothetical protein